MCAAVTRIRNTGFAPFLDTEGSFVKPLDCYKLKDVPRWYEGLSTFDRMHYHHTLASVRRNAHFIPHK